MSLVSRSSVLALNVVSGGIPTTQKIAAKGISTTNFNVKASSCS